MKCQHHLSIKEFLFISLIVASVDLEVPNYMSHFLKISGVFYRKRSLDHRQDAPPGSPAAKILETVQRELAEAGSSSSARRQVLRRLVRRLHPDQNRGKETAM